MADFGEAKVRQPPRLADTSIFQQLLKYGNILGRHFTGEERKNIKTKPSRRRADADRARAGSRQRELGKIRANGHDSPTNASKKAAVRKNVLAHSGLSPDVLFPENRRLTNK
jgi:hypothetical protein